MRDKEEPIWDVMREDQRQQSEKTANSFIITDYHK